MNNGATRISDESREELHRLVDRLTAPPTVESEITETGVDSGDTYKLDTGVPPPPTVNRPIHRKLKRTIKNMEVGHSFVVQTSKERNCALMAAWNLGIYISTRRQEDGTYRIWRVEKPNDKEATIPQQT